jgi:hypothetical protein
MNLTKAIKLSNKKMKQGKYCEIINNNGNFYVKVIKLSDDDQFLFNAARNLRRFR